MSFSIDVKEELCHIQMNKACCNQAELLGLVSFSGTFVNMQEKKALRIKTENFSVAKRIQTLLKLVFDYDYDITERAKKSGGSSFSIYIYEQKALTNIINKFGFFDGFITKFSINPFLVMKPCCRKAYMRGAFLGGGSVTSPKKSYHFEIETHYMGLSRDLKQLFDEEEIEAKTIKRKSDYVLYIKDSEKIADILALMGATSSMLELYNIKIEKDMKNNINRKVNFETANILKTSSAAARQIAAIKKIFEKKDILLPPSLLELAELRLNEPDMSIKELGERLNPPLTKSGVNHRLNKIIEIAEKGNF